MIVRWVEHRETHHPSRALVGLAVLHPPYDYSTSRRMIVARVGILLSLVFLVGCGGPSAVVKGRVTCQGKPVVGIILFSPKGESVTGPPGSSELDGDGRYELRLTSVGKHSVVITPKDVQLKPKAGQFDYPCDRSPLEREVKAGENEISIDLVKRTR